MDDNRKEREYVTHGAMMRCSFGTKDVDIHVPSDRSTYMCRERAANARDVTPDCNLLFGGCQEGGHCYSAQKSNWQDIKTDVYIDDFPAVVKQTSWSYCEVGGIIRFVDSGQNEEGMETDEQEFEEYEQQNED